MDGKLSIKLFFNNNHEIIIDGSYSFDKSQANTEGSFSDTKYICYQISPRYLLDLKMIKLNI